MKKFNKHIINASRNPVLSNIITFIFTGLCSIFFVKTCEERKMTNTYFDFDPPKTGTNFVSIHPGRNGIGVSGSSNEIYADFSKSDTIFCSLFVDYRNGGTEIIDEPKVILETYQTKGQSDFFILYGELLAKNCPPIKDNAIIKNLPEKWKIEFLSHATYFGHQTLVHVGVISFTQKLHLSFFFASILFISRYGE